MARARGSDGALGPFMLQAAIAACHAEAQRAEDTDWTRITALYDALAQLTPSPVIELNRGVAYAMAYGPAAGLEIVDALLAEPSLQSYHLLPSVRAASLTSNTRERDLLRERARTIGAPPRPSGNNR